jgi:hypothetical protein
MDHNFFVKNKLVFFLFRNLRFPLESVDDLEHLTDLWNSKGEAALVNIFIYIIVQCTMYLLLLQFERLGSVSSLRF